MGSCRATDCGERGRLPNIAVRGADQVVGRDTRAAPHWPESAPWRRELDAYIARICRRSRHSRRSAETIALGACGSRNPLIGTPVNRQDAKVLSARSRRTPSGRSSVLRRLGGSTGPSHPDLDDPLSAVRRNAQRIPPYRPHRPPQRAAPTFTARSSEPSGAGQRSPVVAARHFFSRIECELSPSIARISDE